MKVIIIMLIFLFDSSFYVSAQNWSAVSDGVPFSVYTIYGDEDEGLLYVGGGFSVEGSFAVWNGSQWDNMGFPQNGEPISTISKFHEVIYVCGGFNFIDSTLCKGLVKWNGQFWDSVTTQVDDGSLWYGGISGMLATDSFLYVLGSFDSISHVKSPGIIKYDGTHWIAVGDFEGSFPGGATVEVLSCAAMYNNELYVGGNYYGAGNLERIAKFDGAQWSNVGQGINGGAAGVEDLQVYKDELYAAGTFTKIGGDPGDFIAKWNGTSWSEVGSGMLGGNGQIHDLLVYNDELYACGTFHYAGGVDAFHVAKWNGHQWCGFGDTLDNVSIALGSLNGELYMGGGFKVIGANSIETGDSINHIAKWIGGNYVDSCSVPVGISDISEDDFSFSLFPNPANDQLYLSFKILPITKTLVTITNLMGAQMLSRVLDISDPVIDLSLLQRGIYFICLTTEKGSVRRKFIKQ